MIRNVLIGRRVLAASLAGFSLAVCLICVGCQPSSEGDSGEPRVIDTENPVLVTATVGMVADLVRRVGGDRVEVTQICGSGVDPHLYKVTRDDVQTIRSADLVFYSGLMLEGKMSDALIKEARHRPVIAVTEELDESLLLEPEEFEGHYDPHVWMDVAAWSKCVDVIEAELSKFDPDGASGYQANASAVNDDLEKLHQYGLETLASILKKAECW